MTNLFREDLVLKTSVVECWSILSINPLDWHLKQYVIDISVDTLSTIDQKSVDSLPSVNRLDVNTCRLRVNRLVTDCPLRCQWSVDGVSYSEVDQESWFIESINWQLMADVLTTHDSVSTAVLNCNFTGNDMATDIDILINGQCFESCLSCMQF